MQVLGRFERSYFGFLEDVGLNSLPFTILSSNFKIKHAQYQTDQSVTKRGRNIFYLGFYLTEISVWLKGTKVVSSLVADRLTVLGIPGKLSLYQFTTLSTYEKIMKSEHNLGSDSRYREDRAVGTHVTEVPICCCTSARKRDWPTPRHCADV